MRGLILLSFIFTFQFVQAGTRLLSQPPRAYEKYQGFNEKNGTCKNVVEPTRQRLLQLRARGHKVVMIMTSGSPIKMSKWRIRDDFQGVRYSDINSYVEAVEDFARRNTSYQQASEYQDKVRRCLRGYRGGELAGRSCVVPTDVRYFHMGFAVLDPRFSPQPFIVHFYGDPETNFLRASIFVETLDSYLQEDRLTHCDATLMTLGSRMERKLFKFLKGDHAQQLLARGNRSYNLVSNPWALRSQNCNIWISEVMASAYFVSEDSWPKTDRWLAKRVLSQTHFRPIKVPMTTLQSLGRLAAPFIGGINSEEGNINHRYGVADIVPARSIIEWLERLDEVKSIDTVYGHR